MTNRRVISGIRQIGREEWRYWLRSKTATALGVATLLLIATSLTTNYVRINSEREARLQLQAVAEETFRNQPARHPHRMIHYGHYVFRTPAPLAIADLVLILIPARLCFWKGTDKIRPPLHRDTPRHCPGRWQRYLLPSPTNCLCPCYLLSLALRH